MFFFADSPLLLKIPEFGGRRKPQKTAFFLQETEDFHRKPQETADWLRHLRSVTFSLALNRKKMEQIGTDRVVPENKQRKSEEIRRKRGNRNKSAPFLIEGHRRKEAQMGRKSLALTESPHANPLCPPAPSQNSWWM